MNKYDYFIVGAGFFGSTLAYELEKRGKSVWVIEKRDHIGGNCYTENINGIHVHKHGAHIFHTRETIVTEWYLVCDWLVPMRLKRLPIV